MVDGRAIKVTVAKPREERTGGNNNRRPMASNNSRW
jgi:hypothetical protein